MWTEPMYLRYQLIQLRLGTTNTGPLFLQISNCNLLFGANLQIKIKAATYISGTIVLYNTVGRVLIADCEFL